jgi:hypothetical protein
MISRSILIGALVVVELAIVGAAFRALGGGGGAASERHPFRLGDGRIVVGGGIAATITQGTKV